MSGNDEKGTREHHRATIDEAREQGIGDPEQGGEPTVPSYADTGDVSDLGVDEPVVPRALQGRHAADPDDAPVTCANCGGAIEQDDLICPHCGVSLVAG